MNLIVYSFRGRRHVDFSLSQFMMHSALDRLEEFLGSPRYFDLVKMQRGSKWLGSLLPMEDCEIYGYVTPSCTKILALVKRDSVIPLEKRREVDLRALFVSMQKTIVSPQQKQLEICC